MNEHIGRRNYFIDKKLQTKLIIHFGLLASVPLVLTLALLLFFSRNSYTVAIQNTQVSAKTTADFFSSITLPTILIVFVFSSAATALSMLFFSHRISGPLSRLIKEVYLLEKGDLTQKFQIRDKDHTKVFSESLSHMSLALKNDFIDLKEQYHSLRKFLEDKNFVLSDSDKKHVADLLRAIEEKLSRFKTS